MRNTTINVSFNTEKLDALKFHMEKRDTDLQGEDVYKRQILGCVEAMVEGILGMAQRG